MCKCTKDCDYCKKRNPGCCEDDTEYWDNELDKSIKLDEPAETN